MGKGKRSRARRAATSPRSTPTTDDLVAEEPVVIEPAPAELLDVKRVVAAFKSEVRPSMGLPAGSGVSDVLLPGGVLFLGSGVIRCEKCRRTLSVDLPRVQGPRTGPHDATYVCQCGATRMRVPAVDRELQNFVLRRTQDPDYLRRWRESRLADLDDQLAMRISICGWCSDAQRRRRLSKHLGRRNFGFRARDRWRTLTWNSKNFISATCELARERAAIATGLGQPRLTSMSLPLSALSDLEGKFKNLWIFAIHHATEPPSAEAWRQAEKLLARTDWRNVPDGWPASGHFPLLDDSWEASPLTQVSLRRELLLSALGADRLIVGRNFDGTVNLRIITLSD